MQYCPTNLLHRPLPPPPPRHPHRLLLHIIQHSQPLPRSFIGDEDSFGEASTFDASPFSGATENLDALSFGAPAPFFGAACMFSLVVGGLEGMASAPDLILTPHTSITTSTSSIRSC